MKPSSGQQFIELTHWMAIGHALQHILEVSKRLDVIEFRGSQQRCDNPPARCAAVGSREQVVFAAKRDRPDGTFDCVVIEFNTAVIEEAAKSTPARQRIADSIRKAGTWWYAIKFSFDPDLHRV